MDYADKFDQALSYDEFLAKYGSDEHQRRWKEFHAELKLSDARRSLIAGFTRELRVLCLAGAWCGDCVNQCPIFQRFAEVNDRIKLRFVDRDDHPDLQEHLSIGGGKRVPVVVFLSEENKFIGAYGDKTLTAYRKLASGLGGAACATGLTKPEESYLDGVVQDWLDQFERMQLLLRLSPRLRQIHGD
ncbi:hypothetical protein Pan216_54970 [Planctomycetes bacterium Pan216]|uniref:Thiol reductase thioredoxin n=1 Tax=Kolteria novifilia TaxID=2527975 RepID=A0A518BC98_9BACT|nr:hypothetical protein Pan216_54970 [Planctomycetes bacterium Pan216]